MSHGLALSGVNMGWISDTDGSVQNHESLIAWTFTARMILLNPFITLSHMLINKISWPDVSVFYRWFICLIKQFFFCFFPGLVLFWFISLSSPAYIHILYYWSPKAALHTRMNLNNTDIFFNMTHLMIIAALGRDLNDRIVYHGGPSFWCAPVRHTLRAKVRHRGHVQHAWASSSLPSRQSSSPSHLHTARMQRRFQHWNSSAWQRGGSSSPDEALEVIWSKHHMGPIVSDLTCIFPTIHCKTLLNVPPCVTHKWYLHIPVIIIYLHL